MFYYLLVDKYAIIYVQEYVWQQALMCEQLSAAIPSIVNAIDVYFLTILELRH